MFSCPNSKLICLRRKTANLRAVLLILLESKFNQMSPLLSSLKEFLRRAIANGNFKKPYLVRHVIWRLHQTRTKKKDKLTLEGVAPVFNVIASTSLIISLTSFSYLRNFKLSQPWPLSIKPGTQPTWLLSNPNPTSQKPTCSQRPTKNCLRKITEKT